MVHSTPSSGHPGIAATIQLLTNSPPVSGLPSVKSSTSMSASHQVTTLKPTVKWNVSTKSSPISFALIVIGIRPTGVAISFGPNMLRALSANQPQVSHHSNVYWVFNLPYSPGQGNLQICLPSTPGSNRVRGPGMRLMSISNGQSGEQRSRLIVDGASNPNYHPGQWVWLSTRDHI